MTLSSSSYQYSLLEYENEIINVAILISYIYPFIKRLKFFVTDVIYVENLSDFASGSKL